jgi:hypothetical protein|uniref:Uncharacterized protein n=1 Tax=viral metagenome TaxID=1070528 RepID=A0A6C0CEW0_9ZZZZ
MSEAEVFKPNEKELRLFEQEKMDLYKGTFVVCLVYGLSAFLLLVVILFTEWGKEYIYDKFAPAVITYILGSLIIIIYLLNAIFTIRPRRIGTDMDSDANIICPDYWKLEKVPDAIKTEIMDNNINNSSSKKIIPQIGRETNANLQYRCVYDNNVYGNTGDLLRMKNSLADTADPYYAGFNNINNAKTYRNAEIAKTNSTIMPEYIIKEPKKQSEQYQELKKYAKFVGAYSSNNENIFTANNSNALRISNDDYIESGTNDRRSIWKKYENEAPLICNVVYPQVLGVLDSDTRGKNEVSCEYAKECGVSWSALKCK